MAKQIELDMTDAEIAKIVAAVGPAIHAAISEVKGLPNLTWKIEGAGTLALNLFKVHADNLGYSFLHGWFQRMGDAAALGATFNKKLGRVPTLEDKRNAMMRLRDHYESGDDAWDRERTGFKRVDETLEVLVKAVFAWKAGAKTEEECRAFVMGKSKDERYQMFTDRNSKLWVHIKAVMDEMTKTAKTGDELLGDF